MNKNALLVIQVIDNNERLKLIRKLMLFGWKMSEFNNVDDNTYIICHPNGYVYLHPFLSSMTIGRVFYYDIKEFLKVTNFKFNESVKRC